MILDLYDPGTVASTPPASKEQEILTNIKQMQANLTKCKQIAYAHPTHPIPQGRGGGF